MSRDLMDLETGKFVFTYPDEEPEPEIEPEAPQPEPEPEPEPEQIEEEEEEEEEEELQLGGFFRFLITLAVIAGILYGLFAYVFAFFTSYDERMYPFMMDGDIVIAFRHSSYETGDVVLYKNPDTGNTAVSRIAAVGTNTVDISAAGEVLINGSPSELTVYEATPKENTTTVTYPYAMTEGGCFLLNDKRAVVIDSRQFGQIDKEQLIGKVILVIRHGRV